MTLVKLEQNAQSFWAPVASTMGCQLTMAELQGLFMVLWVQDLRQLEHVLSDVLKESYNKVLQAEKRQLQEWLGILTTHEGIPPNCSQ